MKRRRLGWVVVSILVLMSGAVAVGAQEESEEEQKKPWSNKTEFGLTSTSGNADTTNYSLGNNFKYEWTKAEFTFTLAAVQNRTTSLSYEGTAPDYVIVENTETTAETYAANAVYRRDITQRLFWYVGTTWFRNQPGGIEDRYRGNGGLGYKFLDGDKHKFLGELGATYTDESNTDGSSSDYTSANGTLGYTYKISDTAELSSLADAFLDVDDSDNWQANWITSVTASLSSKLALKVSYSVVYNNLPPNRTISGPDGPVAFPSEKTDTFLTASVVVNF
jgi:putative salt-induced outer membrane protein YdiY